ncbi:liver carboxylesterase 1 [Nasonia vitripennis]|uniref:Carboxylesterase type B domain-containing protein n=1 Tax=Nasonia vitripennis TaxID=7425 RepID=A0A7M7G7P1_NASVI|nr:liver carboxylesterase 1 [Nasonia vitripennis]
MDGRLIFALLAAALVGFQGGECNRRVKRIVGGAAAPAPPVDDPIVFVRKEDREARVYGTRDPKIGYYLFRGIRYAEPPVGNRRFQRSVPLYLEGDINATQWAAPCPQPGENGAMIGSEDCLFLNVFTPALPDATDGHPVLIWIHGGGFRRGAATQYEMRNLVDKNTIVVSIQYRLGSLGFLSSGTKDLSGNNGLFDMILATEWVRDYIEFFGGNPNKIVAFGQGTGASSAFLLGLSKFGQKYFSGIVAMSGSVLSRFAVDKEPKNSTVAMATDNNCPTNDTVQMVRCLRQLPAAKLVEQDTKHESLAKQAKNFITDLTTLLNPGPVVEGKNDQRSLPNFVTDEPEDSLNLDDLPEIPLLTGVVKDETGGSVYGPYKNTITETLTAFPDFLAKNLIPNLQKIVPAIGNITQQFVPEAFGKYLTLPFGGGGNGNGKKIDSIAKVTEVLNDAIFNVPAFLTVKNWSKKTKAFLYSFDHQSKHGFGKDFLGGLPLVGNSAENGKTSHGDDLGYVFEANSILGQPMEQKANFDEEDEQVKEAFTGLIADFARSGNVMVKQKSDDQKSSLLPVPSFSGDEDNSFLSITSKPQISKNFRFCEMGLWTGIAERYKSTACSLFMVDLKDPLKTIQKTFSSISQVPQLAKVGSVADFVNVDTIAKPDLSKLPISPQIIPNPLANLQNGKSPIPTEIIPNPLAGNQQNGKSAIPQIITNPLGDKMNPNSPTIPTKLPGLLNSRKNPLGGLFGR